ncbi:hypothetical protein E2C01_001799 [Portunus trituberculatus]|uniref:Uncharacterized protein n=1 Tax=Portunus trituberculatus TaxID=210409 RepID=A0A5B7CI66_PORTR|nr:hypothetical protein [Portunus trituberculatus]
MPTKEEDTRGEKATIKKQQRQNLQQHNVWHYKHSTSQPPYNNTYNREGHSSKNDGMYDARTFINSINPGSYNEEFNRALKLNNLPPVILPDNPPSKKILNLTKDNQTITSQQSTKNTETSENTN